MFGDGLKGREEDSVMSDSVIDSDLVFTLNAWTRSMEVCFANALGQSSS